MEYFKILHKSTDRSPVQTIAGIKVKVLYLIDEELNVWEVFKGDSEIVVEKNPDLYVQFTKEGDMNRVQKMKADLVKIESGTHGFGKNGDIIKGGVKAQPTFSNIHHEHNFVNTNSGVKYCTICRIEEPLKYLEP